MNQLESVFEYCVCVCVCVCVWLCFIIIHCSPLHCDHTSRSEQPCESSPPLCVTVHLTSFEKMKVQLQCTSRHSLTAEMRLEALKTHGTRLWSTTSKQATRQLLLCYRRKPNQSAVCCSLRLNCTTMFQILVRSAVYTQTADSTQESREMHANAFALSTSGCCSSKNHCSQTSVLRLWDITFSMSQSFIRKWTGEHLEELILEKTQMCFPWENITLLNINNF